MANTRKRPKAQRHACSQDASGQTCWAEVTLDQAGTTEAHPVGPRHS